MKFTLANSLKNWWQSWQQHPTTIWILSILWLLLISWLAFLWNLGNIGLVDETEPLFAEAARQMTVTGDWITPYFNGETRFDKPPLIYWLMAIGYRLIGVNEWAVRLPSALSAIALTGLAFYTLRYYGISRPAAFTPDVDSTQHRDSKINPSYPQRQLWLCAWIGSTLMAVNLQTIIWARTGVSDMLLSGCVGGALLSFFLGYAHRNHRNTGAQELGSSGTTVAKSPSPPHKYPCRWYLACYVLIALAILTKGPVGIVLPTVIIGGFLLYLGNGREVLQEMCLFRGIVIILALTLPWYVLVTLANGQGYIDSFFGYHNIQRFTRTVNRHAGPWYFYFPVVLVAFAPWSSYLPFAIARLKFWRRLRWRNSPRSTHLGLFALFWFVGIFGFFTIAATKLPSYVLPLIPAAAILLALLWSDQLTHTRTLSWSAPVPLSPSMLLSSLFNLLLLIALASAIFLAPEYIGSGPAAPDLPEQLQESGLMVRGGIIWSLTAIVAALLLWRRWLFGVWIVNLVGFLAFLIFVLTPTFLLVDQVRQLPLRQLSAIAVQEKQSSEELIMIGFKKPSVVFYTQQPVTYMSKGKKARNYMKEIAVTQPSPPSVLMLARNKRLKKAKLKPDQYTTLASLGPYKLIRVSKQIFVDNSKLKN
ncbi:MAG: glycosyltransferase family 39 protein [Moorea sp. SIOASIH]|nr:glycosyltransferase family 39 protein [Moorena sp. SIOASIH]NEO35953.1 glycosyltransferase family 39 protein [Moorena sp. SIOASIH]